jgi:hypothetical protein
MNEQTRLLYYLEELSEYQVSTGYSDVRGWDVRDANDRYIGFVDRLLVNRNTERVVYLDVEVDASVIKDGYDVFQVPASAGVHGFSNKEGENHLIIPIGMASLDEKSKKVTTNEIDSSTFAKVRRFRKGEIIDSQYEIDVLHHYKGDNTIAIETLDDKFYEQTEFINPMLIHKEPD